MGNGLWYNMSNLFSQKLKGGTIMKKVLAIVLSLTMMLALAAPAMADGLAVGTYDPATAGTVELGFGWWGNQVRDEVTKNAADYFTENYPNITFNLNAQSWNNYWALMSTYAANNDLPDVMQQDYAYIEQWVEAGDLLDLTPYVESGALDLSTMPESVIATGKVGDGLYAVCCAVNAPAMLYNKTLTDSLGIEVPMNITWDQYVEISKKIYAETGIGAIYGDGNSENPLTYYARSLGYTALWDENGLLPTAEEMAGYYQRLITGVAEGWMYDTDKLAGVNTADLAQYPLVYGASNEVRAWNALCFSNQVAAYTAAANADGIELGFSTWPSIDPVKSNYMKPGQFFAVTTDAENPDLAVAFLNYLLNDVQGNILLRAERGVPPCTATAAAIADEVGKADPTYPASVDYLAIVGENCSPIFPPLPSYAGTAQTEVIQMLAEECLLKGTSMTAEEAGQMAVEMIADIASSF